MIKKSRLTIVREKGVLKIAVAFSPPPEEGHSPEFYLDKKSGKPTGVVCELGKVMAKDLGVRPKFVDIPWPGHLQALLSDKVDLLMSYTNTPIRAIELEFAGPLLPSKAVIIVSKDNQIKQKDELNEQNKRIGIWHGSSIIDAVHAHFPLSTISEHANPTSEVKAGKLDGCVVDAVTKIFMGKNPELCLLRDKNDKIEVLAQEWGHPAVKSGDQIFLNWINNWLNYHNNQGTINYWCNNWWQSWMAD